MHTKQSISLLFCLLAFSSTAQDRFSDCEGAIILCDNSDLIVKKLYGVGQELSEVGFTSCSERLKERNTVWIKWQVGTPGSIEFTIEPLESGDDIDFIVYRLDDDIRHCSRKFEVRCMASGEAVGAPSEESFACMGKMGLSAHVSDVRESDGCDDGHDNFLAALEAKKGESYILYVNNYTSDNGFRLEWGGDAAFVTPQELELPATDPTQPSKAIYFKKSDNSTEFKTGWQEAPISKAFVATLPNSLVPNVFAGCMPDRDNPEKSIRQEAFDIGDLYPNPASTHTHALITTTRNAVVRVEMYDILGKSFFTKEYVVDRGQQLLQLPVQHLSPGFYFVFFRIGKSLLTRKLIAAFK